MCRKAPPLLLVMGMFLVSCDRHIIEGSVVNAQGEALPGVAARLEGSEKQTLTDALGRYSMTSAASGLTLRFLKNGYTAASLSVQAGQRLRVEAPRVTLWNLPDSKGVFLFEDFRYRPVLFAEAQQYMTPAKSLLYGTTRWTHVETENRQPRVFCYRMPIQGVRLCEMELTEALRQETPDRVSPVEVWAQGQTVSVSLTPIDEEGLLLEVVLSAPLAPGAYALHWGALEGDATLDKRLFLFNIAESKPVASEESQSPPTGETKPAQEPNAQASQKSKERPAKSSASAESNKSKKGKQ
jgi:hypothetical protein